MNENLRKRLEAARDVLKQNRDAGLRQAAAYEKQAKEQREIAADSEAALIELEHLLEANP